MGIIIGILIIINIFLIGVIISKDIDANFYKNRCELYFNELSKLRIKAVMEQSKNKHQNNSQNIYDNDIREAVKYAMKKSHPDNGGSSDEFNKFRELYNKIK